MSESSDGMRTFIDTQGLELYELLNRRGHDRGIGADDPDGCCYDLMELAEATLRLFNELIPAVLAASDLDHDTLETAWIDAWTEFRHIDYHLHATILPED